MCKKTYVLTICRVYVKSLKKDKSREDSKYKPQTLNPKFQTRNCLDVAPRMPHKEVDEHVGEKRPKLGAT